MNAAGVVRPPGETLATVYSPIDNDVLAWAVPSGPRCSNSGLVPTGSLTLKDGMSAAHAEAINEKPDRWAEEITSACPEYLCQGNFTLSSG